jgi:hypothetical protein
MPANNGKVASDLGHMAPTYRGLAVKSHLNLYLKMKKQYIRMKKSELQIIIGQIDEIKKKLRELKK